MMVGLPNPNVIPVLWRMKITNMVTNKSFTVHYNPQSYSISRSANYSEKAGLDSNMPSIQFVSGTTEKLEFDLFFDSFSAGAEIGGTSLSDAADKLKFQGNALLPSIGKQIDIRTYTAKVYDLMITNASVHVPPLVKIEWSKLQFEGHLVSCKQTITKFNERGLAVRAKLHCEFKRYMKPSEIAKMKPNESPDTTKYRTINQGDSLWALAAEEYGQGDQWRAIASANKIINPRLMETGTVLQVPAL